MKVVVQRVSEAAVRVDGEVVGAIGSGLLLLVGICQHDDTAAVTRMATRILGYRLLSDEQGKMNLDVRQAGGQVLAVSQFTLSADTGRGRRPSFTRCAAPALAQPLYQQFIAALQQGGVAVERGVFGADMQVSLVNDGPVTFVLES